MEGIKKYVNFQKVKYSSKLQLFFKKLINISPFIYIIRTIQLKEQIITYSFNIFIFQKKTSHKKLQPIRKIANVVKDYLLQVSKAINIFVY